MTYIFDTMVEAWICTDCGWSGLDEDLMKQWCDKHGETVLVCPYCENKESRNDQ